LPTPSSPEPISLDLAKTVVMVVDRQNDFGSKGGVFDRDGFDLSIIQRAVPLTAKALVSSSSSPQHRLFENGFSTRLQNVLAGQAIGLQNPGFRIAYQA